MATFKRFEEIQSWQKARELAREIYRLTGDGPFSRDFGLRDQIRRASVSMMANVAEGFGRGGNKEFVAFLSIARGSGAEVKSHLYIAADAGLIERADFNRLYSLTDEAEGLISGLMKYLAASAARGRKFAGPNPQP
ncbi:MAG TPA: four helix bundle protein [Opitutaceae bacterium]|nr:four helix bundle protein [Opitutaceae bacterium]